MKLSPKLRQIQQSYFVQTFVVPVGITFVGAAITSLLVASKGNILNLDVPSFYAALGVGGFAALTYIAGIWQHGLGSASFHSDGSENKLVTKVVDITQAIPGPSADNLKVEVEHK